MRTFSELTEAEQAQAREIALNEELEAVCSDAIRFNDEANGDDLQARIDKAVEDMEIMHTPWFLSERLMEDEKIAEVLRGLADGVAEMAQYPDDDEAIIRLTHPTPLKGGIS